MLPGRSCNQSFKGGLRYSKREPDEVGIGLQSLLGPHEASRQTRRLSDLQDEDQRVHNRRRRANHSPYYNRKESDEQVMDKAFSSSCYRTLIYTLTSEIRLFFNLVSWQCDV